MQAHNPASPVSFSAERASSAPARPFVPKLAPRGPRPAGGRHFRRPTTGTPCGNVMAKPPPLCPARSLPRSHPPPTWPGTGMGWAPPHPRGRNAWMGQRPRLLGHHPPTLPTVPTIVSHPTPIHPRALLPTIGSPGPMKSRALPLGPTTGRRLGRPSLAPAAAGGRVPMAVSTGTGCGMAGGSQKGRAGDPWSFVTRSRRQSSRPRVNEFRIALGMRL